LLRIRWAVAKSLPILCDSDADVGVNDPVPLAAQGEIGFPGWLADRQGRQLRYLRLSVTDRCDLACQYCMPAQGVAASPKEDVLSFEEIIRVARVFVRLGVQTIRLTGGEPLVRKGLPELIRMLRQDVGVTDIALTSNGTALRHLASELVAAGLTRINISVDSVDPVVFARLTRGGDLNRVLDGIAAIQDAGIQELKTNAVVVRGHNDGLHLGALVDWAWRQNLVPRFIELMPLGEGAKLGEGAVVPVAEMKASLADRLSSNSLGPNLQRGPASYVAARHDPSRKVGFIGAVTENFCHRCNRVRVTAKGEIRACLASPHGLSLRALMRDGLDDGALFAAVQESLFGKGHGHDFYARGETRHHHVHMSHVGG